jgi:hypothetical protein
MPPTTDLDRDGWDEEGGRWDWDCKIKRRSTPGAKYSQTLRKV